MPNGYPRHRDTDNPSRQACLREVLLTGPVTRKEIAARLGFKSGTVSRLVRPLIDARMMQERMEKPGERPVRPGRRFWPLTIDPQGGQVLGIAIAPTVQTVALADIGGTSWRAPNSRSSRSAIRTMSSGASRRKAAA